MGFLNNVAKFVSKVVAVGAVLGAIATPVNAQVSRNIEKLGGVQTISQVQEKQNNVQQNTEKKESCLQTQVTGIIQTEKGNIEVCISREELQNALGGTQTSPKIPKISMPTMLPGMNFPMANAGKIGYKAYFNNGENKLTLGGPQMVVPYHVMGVNISYGIEDSVAIGGGISKGNVGGMNMFPTDKDVLYYEGAIVIKLNKQLQVGGRYGRSEIGKDFSVFIQGEI